MPLLSAVAIVASISAAFFYAVAIGRLPAPYPMGGYGPFFEFWGSFAAAVGLGFALIYRCQANRTVVIDSVTRLALSVYAIGFGALGVLIFVAGVAEVAKAWGQSWTWLAAIFLAWYGVCAIVPIALAVKAFRLVLRPTTGAAR